MDNLPNLCFWEIPMLDSHPLLKLPTISHKEKWSVEGHEPK